MPLANVKPINAVIPAATWVPATLLLLFLAAVLFRPLIPIDETRYMTVAWEMFLHRGWFEPLTMNFEPYHHKPPLLFWLINLSWAVFGISRWAALVPVFVAALGCVYLTSLLGRSLFPGILHNQQRPWLIMIGSVPFLVYGTLVMFDVMLCVFVLLSLTGTVLYARSRLTRHALFTGVFLGLGVLTKGPVAYLYVLPPLLLAPVWQKDFDRTVSWYAGCLLIVAVSLLPILGWLIPVLKTSSNDFAFWLIWNQTAGRITGNFDAAHSRPMYFYLPILPMFFMPWLFLPAFWQGLRELKGRMERDEGTRFLLVWLLPVIFGFSLISGKQPHYLVPVLPGVVILTALFLERVETRTLARLCSLVLAGFIGLEAIASQTLFIPYDLGPVAEIIRKNPDRDLVFARNYKGEVGFLAKLEKPVDDRPRRELKQWFKQHPAGLAIIRYDDAQDVKDFRMIVSTPHRGKRLGVFSYDPHAAPVKKGHPDNAAKD
jgi:4-amino-4-deoxy-L-arabinose transferase-like glycosyltransferase